MGRKENDVRVVGFDCAEETHDAVLLDASGDEQLKLSVVNRREMIEEALGEVLLALPRGAKLVVVVESKRSHGRLVCDVAFGLGCDVWQVNTVALNHYRDVEGQPRKTDSWDAYLAARMVFQRLKGCREVAESFPEERVLCRLTRTHARLKEDRTAVTQRVRAILVELAPEVLHKSWNGPKYDSKAMVYILKRWPAFDGLERAQLRSIEKILHTCRYGQTATEVAELIREMGKRISMEPLERHVVSLEITLLLKQLEVLDASLAKVDREIKTQVEAHPMGIKLLEMPGIAHLTAGILIGELLPVARHASEGESATYSGVTPLARKSGKSLNRPHLARGVNKRVLHGLYLSSVSAVKCSAVDRAYYHKKLSDYAGHPAKNKAAFIALSRQRHKVIFRLLTSDERYDKEKLIASHLDRVHPAKAA